MRMRVELLAKKTPGSQLRNMQDCRTRCDQRLFMWMSLTTPMLWRPTMLCRRTWTAVLQSFCWHSSYSYEPGQYLVYVFESLPPLLLQLILKLCPEIGIWMNLFFFRGLSYIVTRFFLNPMRFSSPGMSTFTSWQSELGTWCGGLGEVRISKNIGRVGSD